MRTEIRTCCALHALLIFLIAGAASAQAIGPRKAQDAAAAVKARDSLMVTFGSGVTSADTVIVIVAYDKAANQGKIQVSGLGVQSGCTSGYAPPLTNKVGIAFFYCGNVNGKALDNRDVTITSAVKDNLVAIAEEWQGLTAIEDSPAHASASNNNTMPTASTVTSNPDDVIFTAVAYKGGAMLSAPQPSSQPALGYTDSFRAMPTNLNLYPPNLIGSYYIAGTAGAYVNNAILNKSRKWFSATIALEATAPPNPLLHFTPLTDFGPSDPPYTPTIPTQGTVSFPGNLYDGANDLPTASPQHDSDGQHLASLIQPLNTKGEPAKNGKIGVLVIGMSNWTEDTCTGSQAQLPKCDPNTFFDQMKSSGLLNKRVVLADCAQGSAFAPDWMNTTSSTSAWPNCIGPKSAGVDLLHKTYKLNANQVQVVLWEDADDAAFQNAQNQQAPLIGMSSMTSQTCPPNTTGDLSYNQTAPDACVYEWEVANVAREVKILFPNVQLMFLQSRIYGGYTDSRSPHYEPWSYEYGFGTKWLIQAQIYQAAPGGMLDQLAGDLCYQAPCPNGEAPVAPWMAWGPYFWANPPTVPARSDGLQWYGGDLTFDGIHGSWCRFYNVECGRQKVADMMFKFYTQSPYTTPWLLQAGAAP
jgi:hypothetical protein